MKIWLAPYQIKRRSGKSAKGYLLRLQNQDFEYGYADVFPWVQFGDPAFEIIPQKIKMGVDSPLIARSLTLAKLDGMARTQKQSLLPVGQETQNHFLIEEVEPSRIVLVEKALAEGFTRLKIKVGRHWAKEIAFIREIIPLLKQQKLRLDFNSLGEKAQFTELEEISEWIEFIEDPFKESVQWLETKGPWAYDQADFSWQKVKCEWQIMKPARQSHQEIVAPKWIATSLLDHPVGIAHALAQSLSWQGGQQTHGLMSLLVDEPTEFHSGLRCQGDRLSGFGEPGIGFTELLEKQDWQLVRG